MTAKSFKITAFCLFYFVMFSNCFAQFKNPYTNLHLNGHVDSVILSSCSSYTGGGKTHTQDIGEQIMIYNKQGQLKQLDSYSYISVADAGVPKPKRYIYNYDSHDNLIELKEYVDTDKPFTNEAYKIKSKLVISKYYDMLDNSITGENIFKLDSLDRIIETDSYATVVGLFTKSYFKYDVNNNLVEEHTYGSDGTLMFNHYYQYDKDANITKDTKDIKVYKVDRFSRETHTYSYPQYDQMHNWLIQIDSDGSPVIKINERRITYY